MKILLVDDSLDIQCYLRFLLETYHEEGKDKYEVVTANDGAQAWDILQQQDDIQLILTDWMMPKISGIQLCEKVREHTFNRYIYIILLTSKNEQSASILGMKSGADDFLTKPVAKNELRMHLKAGRRILNLEHSLAEKNIKLEREKKKLKKSYYQLEQDLNSAAQLQQALLPKKGRIQNIDFDWKFYSCDYLAGDLFNYQVLDEKHIAFYQIDVAGHGIRSALLSFALYYHLNNQQQTLLLFEGKPQKPANVLHQLNQQFCDNTKELYFTMIYAVINTESGQVQFAQAGHPNPLHIKNNGEIQSCGQGGFPVALMPNIDYQTYHLQLEKGEYLLLYTDGVTECLNLQQEMFTEQRLINQCQTDMNLSKIGQRLKQWQGHQQFDDDVSLLLLQRN